MLRTSSYLIRKKKKNFIGTIFPKEREVNQLFENYCGITLFTKAMFSYDFVTVFLLIINMFLHVKFAEP